MSDEQNQTNTAEGQSELTAVVMPIQPIRADERGTIRFVPNKIVEALLEHSSLDMNKIAVMDFTDQERIQFAQLIGYSVSGFGSLGYVDDETYESACRIVDAGVSEDEARNEVLRLQLSSVRKNIKEAATTLFKIHPDDLEA